MSAKPEVEIKFRIADLPAIEQRLRQLAFTEVHGREHEMNTLYDLRSRRLRRRGELLRLRQYGPRWTLTHKAKGKSGRHKSRMETETTVSDGAAMDAILRSLGFVPGFRYEKFRAEWSDGQGAVVLDETPIGNFGEIEGPPAWIDGTAEKLGIRETDYITQNYASLFLAWKRQTRSKAGEMTFAAVKKTAR